MFVHKYDQVALPNCTVAMGSEIPERPPKKFRAKHYICQDLLYSYIYQPVNIEPMRKKKKESVTYSMTAFPRHT